MEQATKQPVPGSAVTNAYTLVATIYCALFSILYYFVVRSTFLSVIHVLALVSVGINYVVLKRSGNFQRPGVVMTVGTVVVVCMFATARDNTGFLWPFACLMVFMTCNYFIKQKALYYEQLLEDRVQLKTTELVQKAADLAASNAELERFAYFASHDLQEPLNTTSGFVKRLQQQYEGRLDKNAEQYLDFIMQASDRMKKLITELLEYSHIGRQPVLLPINTAELLREVTADLYSVINANNASIRSSGLPTLNAYGTELKLLFQNLISNAIKFRRCHIPPAINIRADKKDGYWQFTVSDNGIGVDPKFHDKIFMLFKRLHSRSEYPGSGIGLAHCKKVAEMHGGRIWVESVPGLGSSFFFTIRIM